MNTCRLVGLGCFGSPETCERIFKKALRHPGRMKISKFRLSGRPAPLKNKAAGFDNMTDDRIRLVTFSG